MLRAWPARTSVEAARASYAPSLHQYVIANGPLCYVAAFLPAARSVPVAYQSTAVGIVTAASYAGTALAFGISPLLISAHGWQWVYYAFGASALLWLPLWLPVDVRPSSGWRGGDEVGAKRAPGGGLAALGALLRRREVLAICIAQYCQSWGMYGLLTWLPTFFTDYYGVALGDLGAYTLLPYVVQGGVGLLAGVLADRLIASGVRTRTVRTVLQVWPGRRCRCLVVTHVTSLLC